MHEGQKQSRFSVERKRLTATDAPALVVIGEDREQFLDDDRPARHRAWKTRPSRLTKTHPSALGCA